MEAYGARCLGEKGSRIFWCSDEFYLQGELPLPEDAFYEAYTQLENGWACSGCWKVELNGAALGPLRISRGALLHRHRCGRRPLSAGNH